jgi:hypothetical protein
MPKKQSEDRHGGSPGGPAKYRLANDWPIYTAFLPVVVVMIGIAAAILFGTGASWHNVILLNAASTESTPGDGYLEGLARHRIVPISPAVSVRRYWTPASVEAKAR